jgi:hypothetical protein
MELVTLDFLTAQLELAEQLLAGRRTMFEPQDLPGRYGRVVKALDHLLEATGCESVVGGGWAVWRHGYVGRVTRDIDIILPAASVDEFLRAASFAGFQVLPVPAGRWPKLVHRETGVDVDILPEGQRPGMPANPAPTTIPHPSRLGARGTALRYVLLPPLIELKLAAGRTQDLADVIKLIQANPEQIVEIQEHLRHVHADYVAEFDRLVQRAHEEADNAS